MLLQDKAGLQFWETCNHEDDSVPAQMNKGRYSLLDADFHVGAQRRHDESILP
jgi:hypothetical protein